MEINGSLIDGSSAMQNGVNGGRHSAPTEEQLSEVEVRGAPVVLLPNEFELAIK